MNVISVGWEVPGNAAEYIGMRSAKSVFDADIIVFTPNLSEYRHDSIYRGARSLTDSDSAALLKDIAHWKNELRTALESGKTVFAMLSKPEEIYYDTGQRQYSGTGRNRHTTTLVQAISSYAALPISLSGLAPRSGTAIAPLDKLGALSSYWSQFGAESAYEAYFDPTGLKPLLGTRKREKVVGGLFHGIEGGTLVLLPPLSIDESELTYERGSSTFWNKKGSQLGTRFIAALVEAATALKRDANRSPVPEWATSPNYSTPEESKLTKQIETIDREMNALSIARHESDKALEEAGVFRWLLFETGKPLEHAILKTLELMGFEATPYVDADSEFDAIFTSPEGRCLGEAEGKDNKAVNVEKIGQLLRNIEEDFAKDETTAYAKGVLFGNASRLIPVADRSDFFTAKCLQTATARSVALVKTPDLFLVAKHLLTTNDDNFAAACRKAIFETTGGIVEFPTPAQAARSLE